MLAYWWILALISGSGLAARYLLFKQANLKLDPALAAFIFGLVLAITSTAYYIYDRQINNKAWISSNIENTSLWLAALAGIAIAFANITLAYAFKAGGSASLTALLQISSGLILTIIFGTILLDESVKGIQIAGIALIFAGIYCVLKT